jgi:tRNA-dihydrouridine synthase B
MIPKSLTIGNKTFPINFIQGPLAGVSCAPFRRLIWQHSQPVFCCTEMISAKTLLQPLRAANRRYVVKAADEGDVCFQLSANDPIELAEATKRATEYGADIIDLNCGCPVKKIRSKGAGSSLLSDARRLYKMIRAMKDNTHVPVSIKIRVAAGKDNFNADVANAVNDGGADCLIVHGRHWTEDYDVSCRYDEIQFFVERMSMPVIGNGDIGCVDSLKKMLATGCAGVMISRAGVGQPWLIAKLSAELANVPFSPPSTAEISAIFLEHAQTLAQLLQHEKQALMQIRSMAKYYGRQIEFRDKFCKDVNASESLDELAQVCKRYFV